MSASSASEQAAGASMASKQQRVSKFKHVFGRSSRKDACFENVHVTTAAHDGNFCAVNPRFVAVVVEAAGGGAFVVLPVKKVGRADPGLPRICGHSGPIMDLKWCPFDDCLIASCSEDMTVKIWEIPERGLDENMMECATELRGHTRRVALVEWHPTAAHVLISAGYDFKCIIWDTYAAETLRVISCHDNAIHSIAWNRDGSLFVTAGKDRKIRVVDPRLGRVVQEGFGHDGLKQQKVLFVTDTNMLFSTGFSKTGDREYAVWDATDLSQPLVRETVDYSSGVLLPFYDYDTRVMYLAGKGDGNIRYYEILTEPPYALYLNQYPSSDPQRGLGWMPKRGLDIRQCEIARFYKLHAGSKQLIEPLSMILPRRSDEFQEDIFPPTAAPTPSLSAREWLSGTNRAPVLLDLKPLYDTAGPIGDEDGRRSNASKTASASGSRRGSFSGRSGLLASLSSSAISNAQASAPAQQLPAAPVLPTYAPASLKNIQKLSTNQDSVVAAMARPPSGPSIVTEANRTSSGSGGGAGGGGGSSTVGSDVGKPVFADKKAQTPQTYSSRAEVVGSTRGRRLDSGDSLDAIEDGDEQPAPSPFPLTLAPRASVERSPSPFDKRPISWQENAAFKPPPQSQPPAIRVNSQLLAPQDEHDVASQQLQRQRSSSADVQLRHDVAMLRDRVQSSAAAALTLPAQMSASLLPVSPLGTSDPRPRPRSGCYDVDSLAVGSRDISRTSHSASDLMQLIGSGGSGGPTQPPSGRYSPGGTFHRLDDESFVILHGPSSPREQRAKPSSSQSTTAGIREVLKEPLERSPPRDAQSEVERKKSLKRMKQAIRRSHSASRVEGRGSPSPEREAGATVRDDADGATAMTAARHGRRPVFKESLLCHSSFDDGGSCEEEEERLRVRRKLEALRKLRDEARAYASGEASPSSSQGSPEGGGSRLSPAKSPSSHGGGGVGAEEWSAAAGQRLSPTRHNQGLSTASAAAAALSAFVATPLQQPAVRESGGSGAASIVAVASPAPPPTTAEARLFTALSAGAAVAVAPPASAAKSPQSVADGKVVASNTYSPLLSVASRTSSQAPSAVYWSQSPQQLTPPTADAVAPTSLAAVATSKHTMEIKPPASSPTRRTAFVYGGLSASGGREVPKRDLPSGAIDAAREQQVAGVATTAATSPVYQNQQQQQQPRQLQVRSSAVETAVTSVSSQQEAGSAAVTYATAAPRTAHGPYYDAREMSAAASSSSSIGRQQRLTDGHRKALSLDAGDETRRPNVTIVQTLQSNNPGGTGDAKNAPVAASSSSRASMSIGGLRYHSLREADEPPLPAQQPERPKPRAETAIDYRAVAAERARLATERRMAGQVAETPVAIPSALTVSATISSKQPQQQQPQPSSQQKPAQLQHPTTTATNGGTLSNDELHKAYFRQVEEIKSLRAQLALRDRQIEKLEREVLRLLQIQS